MAEDSKTYVFGNDSVPAWLAYGNKGFLLGLVFGNWGGFGGFGNGFGGGNAAASLGAQATANSNTELLMNAINGTDADIRQLATMANSDFDSMKTALATISAGLTNVGSQIGLSSLQVVNAIQSGNAALASQLCQCCCENRLAMCQLGNTIGQGFAGVQQSIANKAAADQLATCQQTYSLTDTMNKNFIALDNKIDAMESARKDREITALTAEVAKLESEKYTAAVAQQSVAPVIGQLNALSQEVAAIKRCQPATITLPDNSKTVVPTIWASAVADNIVDRINAALNSTTTTGGAGA